MVVELIRSCWQDIQNETIAVEEITNAKSYVTGVFPIRVETHHGLIDHLVNIKMFDLPDDYSAHLSRPGERSYH